MTHKQLRSFPLVLVLCFVTCGIYWWFYLFGVLRQLEEQVSYEAGDFSPQKARPLLGLLIFLLYVVPIVIIILLAPQIGRELEYAARAAQGWDRFGRAPEPSIGAKILSGLLAVTLAAVQTGIGVTMVRVLSVSQARAGMRVFDRTLAWILLAVACVLLLISEVSVAVLVAAWSCNLVLMYIIVDQSNRIWQHRARFPSPSAQMAGDFTVTPPARLTPMAEPGPSAAQPATLTAQPPGAPPAGPVSEAPAAEEPAFDEKLARRKAEAPASSGVGGQSAEERLARLKNLRDQGLIDEADFVRKRQEIIDSL